MLKTTLTGLRAHLLRLMLTALAITLGVGFVAGTFVLTDTMKAGFDRQFTASAEKVSVAVLPDDDDKKVPDSVLRAVRAVPGVRDAQGLVRGDAALIGKNGRVYGEVPTLGMSITTGSLARYPITKGRAPNGPAEAVLDTGVAGHTGYHVGDTIRVLDKKGATHSFTVTGLVDVGVDQEVGFRGAVGFTEPVARQMTGERGYVEVDVKGAAGVPDDRLRTAVAAAAGSSYTTLTSHGLAKRMAAESSLDVDSITTFFFAFALVALFVAALVIYNTFNILIAQRTREMALLRCVGATRGQVFRSVLLESAVVGLLASVLGAVVGIGLGYGAAVVFNSGTGTPGGPLAVSATPFLVGIPLGLAVTVLSALMPARTATRVPPVAALRAQAEGRVRGRAGIVRIIIGALFGAAGTGMAVLALTAKPGQGPFLLMVVAGALIFLAVVALSPLIVQALSGLVGGLPARFFGVPGRLALANSRRNPKRAAVTTIALTVGVTLMTMFSVALASTRSTADAHLREQYPVDYRLSAQSGQDDRPVPGAVVTRLRAAPEFSAVIEARRATAHVNGKEVGVGSVTQRYLGQGLKPKVSAGSLADLRPGTVVLNDERAKAFGARVGGTVPVRTGRGTANLRVVAIVTGESLLSGILLDETDFTRSFGPKDPEQVYLIAKKGVSTKVSRAVVDDALKDYPAVRMSSAADLKDQLSKSLDQLFLLVAALLALAIIISLIGIANTLTLSVVERNRESALLRALGLTRRGLRRMLSLEALIISLIGALVGVVLGIAFGWAAISAAIDDAVLGLPIGRIVLFLLLAAVAGVVAAIMPGRRAARTSIVESLAAE
ncbi:FtsX-like permease family protein [Actinoallomurus spadix]|uniref:ABC transporter permease n=1 Tax=Actinoallomurus spadix TaxID=79912 RepID=A0ABP3G5D4_9ACTN|nr:FtsX-like permease family protein [Actinoallomurus spadix]MCO5987297.1 FtsX-like permease family protein [Actinoallomurus spadix]